MRRAIRPHETYGMIGKGGMLWCARAVPARRAGRTSASPRRPSNIRKAPFARGYFLGDYMGMYDTGRADQPPSLCWFRLLS
jgi:hypothetical protein